MLKFQHEKQKAIQFSVNLEGDTQKYALSFLHIWNNAREYPNMFYKVGNNSGNDVFVTCNPKYQKEIKEYLEQFGEIWDMEEINYMVISATYDRNGWNELFGDDCEVKFAVEID